MQTFKMQSTFIAKVEIKSLSQWRQVVNRHHLFAIGMGKTNEQDKARDKLIILVDNNKKNGNILPNHQTNCSCRK